MLWVSPDDSLQSAQVVSYLFVLSFVALLISSVLQNLLVQLLQMIELLVSLIRDLALFTLVRATALVQFRRTLVRQVVLCDLDELVVVGVFDALHQVESLALDVFLCCA